MSIVAAAGDLSPPGTTNGEATRVTPGSAPTCWAARCAARPTAGLETSTPSTRTVMVWNPELPESAIRSRPVSFSPGDGRLARGEPVEQPLVAEGPARRGEAEQHQQHPRDDDDPGAPAQRGAEVTRAERDRSGWDAP